jgi:hypothetical protein
MTSDAVGQGRLRARRKLVHIRRSPHPRELPGGDQMVQQIRI